MEHAGVDGGRQQVGGGGDGVDVSRHVQVELLHGDDLQGCGGVVDVWVGGWVAGAGMRTAMWSRLQVLVGPDLKHETSRGVQTGRQAAHPTCSSCDVQRLP